jgi:uncharacterized membrane protein
MNKTFQKIMTTLISYFLQGLLVVVPLAATFYVLFSLFVFIDNLLPFEYPGIGALILLTSLTFLGFLAKSIIANPIARYLEGLLKQAPLIKTIYTAFKDLLGAFVGKKRSFNKPVLVKLNRESQVEKPGFVTNKELHKLGIEGEKVAVYLPHSYAFSGNLFVVPAENITPVNVKSADFMKFIVSGGVAEVEQKVNQTNI